MIYTKEEELAAIQYSERLSEKARRHFLAREYERLGRGSQAYLSKVFGCSRWTITKGVKELSGASVLDYSRQRKAGGGRKKRVVGT
jgi:hypothetical protein